jgi:beta-N-acetylhexosaminidase
MLARRALLTIPLLLAALPSAMHPENDPSARKALSPEARRWVESTMGALSTEEKIGQIVFPTYFGGFESTESQEYKDLMARVEKDHIGGFILGTRRNARGIELGHVYETALLTNQLQHAAKYPLLIGADFERGVVMRVEEGTPFPHAMALGATGRSEDAYAMGRITAIEGRAIGVPWAFAPVADVNSNPDNPIINIRSFGEDPKRVAEYVAQFVRGVEENGGMATAKHFPGHGDTAVDSHLELPLVKADRARLEAVEFVPFRAAMDAGVSAIMTAHLAVPALEPNPDTPATLSHNVLTGVLRDEMHFEGLVVTDALDMGGVTKGFPPGETAVRALAAGADVLLMSPVTDAALAAVREAVQSGRIPMSRLDEAVHRLLVAKARLGLSQQREVDLDKLNAVYRRPEAVAAAQDIADRGVTLLRNDAGLVPLDPRTTRRIFLLAVSADPDTNPAEPFERALREELDSLESLHVDTRYFRVEETHLPPPESYDLAICALTVRVADRKATVGLPPNEAELVHALLQAGKPVIMVGLGSPYLVEGFPEATTWLSAFSFQDIAQRAAARALLGDLGVSGKLPVSLPGAAPHPLHVADGMTTAPISLALQPAPAELEARLRPVYELLERGAAESPNVSGTLEVAFRGQRVVHTFGRTPISDLLPSRAEANRQGGSVYGATSAQPILATALARLVQLKQLTLDTPISRALQGENLSSTRADWSSATLGRLLEGNAIEPLQWVPPDVPRRAEDLASQSLLLTQSGVEALIVTRLTGLEEVMAIRQLIFTPLGLDYYPEFVRSSVDLDRSARQRCEELSVVGQLWLNGGIYGHKRLLNRKVMEQFLVPTRTGEEVSTPGWKLAPAPGRSFTAKAFGWSAPGGTSLWIDPGRDISIAYTPGSAGLGAPTTTARDAAMHEFSAQIHDAIFRSLGLTE